MVNYYLDLCKKHSLHNNVIMLYTLELEDYVNPIKYLVTIENDKRVFFYLGLILQRKTNHLVRFQHSSMFETIIK